MDTRLSQRLGDPNSNIWTQATHRVPMLNDAQTDLVLSLLSFSQEYSHIFDLLSGLQKLDSAISVGTSGFALSGLSGTYLENGYVNSSAILDNKVRWVVRITADKLGITQNSFLGGTDRSPKAYVWEKKFYMLVTLGSYPVTVDFYYITEPTLMAISGPVNSDLNVILHNLVVKIAAVKCLAMRMDAKDAVRIQQLENAIERDISRVASGSAKSPKSNTTGQHLRERKEMLNKTIEIQQQNLELQNANANT